jgi:predicted dinucleotide-binding enzyme
VIRVGVIGSGIGGEASADRLLELRHQVRMGPRDHRGRAAHWAGRAGHRAHAGDFAKVAAFGELVVNANTGSR